MKSSKEARKIPYLIVRPEDGATSWIQCSWKIVQINFPVLKIVRNVVNAKPNLRFYASKTCSELISVSTSCTFRWRSWSTSTFTYSREARSTDGRTDGRTLRRIDGLISPLPCSLPRVLPILSDPTLISRLSRGHYAVGDGPSLPNPQSPLHSPRQGARFTFSQFTRFTNGWRHY